MGTARYRRWLHGAVQSRIATPRAAAGFHRARCSLLAKICAARLLLCAKTRTAFCSLPRKARALRKFCPRRKAVTRPVYVIEQDRASRTKIKAGIEKLLSCDVTVAGCVLNGVQAGLSGYGYGKYGYGYGYGKYGRYGHYGYGHYGAHRTREETV